MTTVNTQLLDNLGLSLSSQTTQSSDDLGKSDFLKLMTTQLQNQDPTKPMESGEFFSQIAQFSMVAGVEELKSSFQQVADAMYSTQSLQASAMVGRSVLIPGSEVTLTAGESMNAGVTLPASTSNLVIGVVDESGQLVRRFDLGPQSEGNLSFTWDGLDGNGVAVSPGDYYLVAQMDYDGESVALDTLVTSKVNSVVMGKSGQGIMLNLSNNDQVSLSDVVQIM